MWRKTILWRSLFLLVICCCLTASANDHKSVRPAQASFLIKNAFVVKVPKDAQTTRIWFAVPQEDAYSKITDFKVVSDEPVSYNWDSWRNKVGYLEVRGAAHPEIHVTETFALTRTEMRNTIDPKATRPLTDAERTALSRYLTPTTYVIINDQIKALAQQITDGETNPVLAARKIYDWTLQNIDYWVKYPDRLKASSTGSTEFCLRTKSGNCTDFHSLFASLAMAAGIPMRMIYGSLLKPTLDGVPVDASYHCWIQFYAPNLGWLPLDVSLANIYGKEFPLTDQNKKLVELTTATGYKGFDPSKIDYYFGNLDDRRVVWSMGRDLMMQPPEDDGPVNSFPKAYVEVNGKQYTDWTRTFTYKSLTPDTDH
ncbi:MAG: transglutaminase domain-containing protein [Candidatus Acidiferrales bacterium]